MKGIFFLNQSFGKMMKKGYVDKFKVILKKLFKINKKINMWSVDKYVDKKGV